MDLQQLTTFFGWMTLINVILLTFSSIMVMLLRGVMVRWHGKLFGLSEEQINLAVYGYLGVYKIMILVFVIAPYIALLLMQ